MLVPEQIQSLDEIADFIEGRMEEFYGRAVEQLPYESKKADIKVVGIPTPMICCSEKLGLTSPKTTTDTLHRQSSMKLETMSGVITTG